MTKQDIIEYVMNTPHNTNKAVLSSILNQLADGGGGGSSDFSTATVTITYILPEGVTSLEGSSIQGNLYVRDKSEDHNTLVNFAYGTNGLPISDLGTFENMNVPIYKDYPSDIGQLSFTVPEVGTLIIDPFNSSVVSGEAVIDNLLYLVLVSGDCSLNIALAIAD